MTRQVMRGEALATSLAFSMPSGVSIMHWMPRVSGAPAASIRPSNSCTMAALSTFGSSSASAPEPARAFTSSRPQGESSAFTRTTISRRP
jgi:hypothetical protein